MARKKPATADRAAYMRERRRLAADEGRCSKCTARKPKKGCAQCKVCIERGTEGMRAWRVKRNVRRLLGEE